MSFFPHLYQSNGSWFVSKFRFRSNSWEPIDRISPNVISAFILAWSSLGLLDIIFCIFVSDYGPLFTQKFCFLSISWERIDRISPNFIYAFIFARSNLHMLHVIFRTFVQEWWPFIYAKILFPLNILRTNWQKFTKFYLCIHIDKI